MGVKTALAGITFTTGGKNQAEIAGVDLTGMINELQLECQEIVTKISYLINDVLTPAGTESANISTLNTQITNLS